jgi:hypothetical protein
MSDTDLSDYEVGVQAIQAANWPYPTLCGLPIARRKH